MGIIQGVIKICLENLIGDKTHQNKLLFYLPFFRKIFLNPDKILISLIINFGTCQCVRGILKAKGDKKLDSQAKTNSLFAMRMILILRTTIDQGHKPFN
jgi:hypothetical protein